jgi:uncharacterized protein YjiS (DUF1127 family)
LCPEPTGTPGTNWAPAESAEGDRYMAHTDFNIVGRVSQLLSNLATFWREAHTNRHVNELPEHILKDIGWPDAYAEPCWRQGSPVWH